MTRHTRLEMLTGWCLVTSFIFLVAGALLYLSRPATLPPGPVALRVIVERSLIWGAIILAMAGFFLLGRLLRSAPGRGWRVGGALLYAIGGALWVAAEMIALRSHVSHDWMTESYIVLGFLGQAAVGAGIVRSKALSSSVGWFAVAWCLGWLGAVLVSSSAYIPALHHVVPLVIGVTLLSRRWEASVGRYTPPPSSAGRGAPM